ncbi:reticulon-4-interacting protein [Histoplasma capsulatum G186AR]|uniref:Reticulon-4-interacting protein n=1 Tax=Ajellomyces capsulatus TaxID=5037 RepID=A0A8H7Z7W6_AJECA|nr:reticulon-4-interacting protein [Histoplasma capsulatum]QSS69386.1 reticulon-4-interacting protein [Histoplasma capsulatum G186AR]
MGVEGFGFVGCVRGGMRSLLGISCGLMKCWIIRRNEKGWVRRLEGAAGRLWILYWIVLGDRR